MTDYLPRGGWVGQLDCINILKVLLELQLALLNDADLPMSQKQQAVASSSKWAVVVGSSELRVEVGSSPPPSDADLGAVGQADEQRDANGVPIS